MPEKIYKELGVFIPQLDYSRCSSFIPPPRFKERHVHFKKGCKRDSVSYKIVMHQTKRQKQTHLHKTLGIITINSFFPPVNNKIYVISFYQLFITKLNKYNSAENEAINN